MAKKIVVQNCLGHLSIFQFTGKALEMYQKYWHWEDALSLAQNRSWQGLPDLREKHLKWLLESGQTAKAAAIIEQENSGRAVGLYLEANRAAKAARIILAYDRDEMSQNKSLVDDVMRALKKSDSMELAGQLYEKLDNVSAAIESYAQAAAYARALELARSHEPNLVVGLEKDWGCHLAATGHYDAAINHLIEAGETLLALNAAVDARQWRKALEIIKVMQYCSNDFVVTFVIKKLKMFYFKIEFIVVTFMNTLQLRKPTKSCYQLTMNS